MECSEREDPNNQRTLQDGRILYVPAHPRDACGEVAFELRTIDRLGPAILGFSSHSRLRAALGEFQPWLAFDTGWLEAHARTVGAVICVDPQVSPAARRWTANDLAAFIGGGA